MNRYKQTGWTHGIIYSFSFISVCFVSDFKLPERGLCVRSFKICIFRITSGKCFFFFFLYRRDGGGSNTPYNPPRILEICQESRDFDVHVKMKCRLAKQAYKYKPVWLAYIFVAYFIVIPWPRDVRMTSSFQLLNISWSQWSPPCLAGQITCLCWCYDRCSTCLNR